MNEPRNSFGQALKRLLEAKGQTSRQAARSARMDATYLSRLLNDRTDSMPTTETVSRVAAALQCTETEALELFRAAGRLDPEMEHAAFEAMKRPELRRLILAATRLTDDEATTISARLVGSERR